MEGIKTWRASSACLLRGKVPFCGGFVKADFGRFSGGVCLYSACGPGGFTDRTTAHCGGFAGRTVILVTVVVGVLMAMS